MAELCFQVPIGPASSRGRMAERHDGPEVRGGVPPLAAQAGPVCPQGGCRVPVGPEGQRCGRGP